MISPRKLFHFISYLQYPLMASSFIFYIPFMISLGNAEPNWADLNNVLILVGVALSLSTLQDTSTTQNNISKRIWESPAKGKITLTMISIFAFLMITAGLSALYLSESPALEAVAVGITVLGIGMIGMLKSAIEMFENHRLDKNGPVIESIDSEIEVAEPVEKPVKKAKV